MPRSRKSSTSDANSLSYDSKTIIVVLLLLLAYPIGAVLMWMWMGKWPIWLKAIITVPFVFGILAATFMILIMFAFIRSANFEVRERHHMYYYSPSPSVVQISPKPAGGTY